METTSLNASKALAFLSNFTSLFKPIKLSFAANASNLNKALSKSTRVYPQVGSAVPPTPVKLGDYVVGEFKQGGVVIWVTDDGQHGLVASIVNLNGANGYAWAIAPHDNTCIPNTYNNSSLPPTYEYPQTPNKNYGGYLNQQAVIQSGNIDSFPAFKAAASYTITVDGMTYGDWFLPSLTEMEQIAKCSFEIDVASEKHNGNELYRGAGAGLGLYWTTVSKSQDCSQASSYALLYQDEDPQKKNLSYPVRCVRAF